MTTYEDIAASPWMKGQVRVHLINLLGWTKKYGYRFTEDELEKLQEIIKEGTRGDGEPPEALQ